MSRLLLQGEPALFEPLLDIERDLCRQGYIRVCGVDEAGRGPLAGPVVAAAVIFRDMEIMTLAKDSKKVNVHARERFFERACAELEYAVGICTHAEIDRLNILEASMLAMRRAVSGLISMPDYVLVDGNRKPGSEVQTRAIVRGDARVAVIGAASIIAKVTRDRMMREYDDKYPGYGFARHFGYPTAEHRALLKQLGPSEIHRRTFRGVHELLAMDGPPATGQQRP